MGFINNVCDWQVPLLSLAVWHARCLNVGLNNVWVWQCGTPLLTKHRCLNMGFNNNVWVWQCGTPLLTKHKCLNVCDWQVPLLSLSVADEAQMIQCLWLTGALAEFGSVARHVYSHASVPVLIVPSRAACESCVCVCVCVYCMYMRVSMSKRVTKRLCCLWLPKKHVRCNCNLAWYVV